MPTQSRPLRQRVTALCVVVGGVLVFLATGAAAVAAQNRAHIDTLLTETEPLRTDAEALLAALVNQEAGIRGYANSGQSEDLAPYEKGVKQEQELIDKMDALLDRRPLIRQQLHAVRDQAAQWRQRVAVPVIEQVATDPAAAQDLLNPEARERFEALRTSVDQLQASILDLRERAAFDARSTGNTLVLLLVAAASVVALGGAALLLSLNRLVVGPLAVLAHQVRDVARGDYHRALDARGPRELAQLRYDVDAMRRKILSDLEEVRQARERIEWVNSQLQQQTEELVRSNRDLEQFAYVASHDLQEPLRKVASFCQLLQRRYAGQLDERADQYIGFAVDGAQRMQRLINDLLAFSRIGRLAAGFVEVDLNAVMVEVTEQTASARRYTAGRLTWSRLPHVQGDETLLTTLLANLVGNSLKFRKPGAPPRVHLSVRRADGEWEITCQDNGIGIEAEFAEKIFAIFQRLHGRDAYPGTGIGLAIAKKVVEYHGGRIWVDPSDGDGGTTIRFTLPVADEYAAANASLGSEPDLTIYGEASADAAPAVATPNNKAGTPAPSPTPSDEAPG
ncbi:MAG TPA: ATP-binding protein [Micromonospora sp.]|nr:ATP-binding protein [Micromonospora sp.]